MDTEVLTCFGQKIRRNNNILTKTREKTLYQLRHNGFRGFVGVDHLSSNFSLSFATASRMARLMNADVLSPMAKAWLLIASRSSAVTRILMSTNLDRYRLTYSRCCAEVLNSLSYIEVLRSCRCK